MSEESTLLSARERVATIAEKNGEARFAAEVRAGAWDSRSDIQAAIRGEALLATEEKPGLMNTHSVLKTICGTVQWAARQASSPVFHEIEFDQESGTFTVTVNLPGPAETYRIMAERV